MKYEDYIISSKYVDGFFKIGDFVTYVVRRGRSRHKCVHYGRIVVHNNRVMIKLFGHASTYAKFYAGMSEFRVLTQEEEINFISKNRQKYLINQVKYIKYILGLKDECIKRKLWFIKTYGLKLNTNLV